MLMDTIDKQRDKNGRFLPGHRFGFQPSQSGNPKGRPKKELSITSIAKAALEAEPKLVQQIVKKWLEQVIEGKTEARRDLLDRLEGRVPVPVQPQVEVQGVVNFVIGRGYVDSSDNKETEDRPDG